MKTLTRALAAMLLSAALTGCQPQPLSKAEAAAAITSSAKAPPGDAESLVGQYGIASGGKVMPLLRISHPSATGPYLLEQWGRGDWKGARSEGHIATTDERKKIEQSGLPDSMIALNFKAMIVVKVAPGYTHDKFKTASGYVLLSVLGPIELTRI